MYDYFFHIVSLERIRPLTHISGCTNRIPLQPTTLEPTVQSLFKKNNQRKILRSLSLPRVFSCCLTVTADVRETPPPHQLPWTFFSAFCLEMLARLSPGLGGPNPTAAESVLCCGIWTPLCGMWSRSSLDERQLPGASCKKENSGMLTRRG